MPKGKNTTIGKMVGSTPIAEITVGKAEKATITEIPFTSTEGLEEQHLQEIYSLLEKHDYDSSELEFICKERDDQQGKYDAEGKAILDCYLKYADLDRGTENEIKKLLKSIHYIKIKI
jgi:hypothetical protein